MRDSGSGQVIIGRKGRDDSEKIYLSPKGSLASRRDVFQEPMYQRVSEILDVIKTHMEEKTPAEINYFKTVESGAMEDYAVVEEKDKSKRLLFRVWPRFFAHHKRLEYKIYEEDPEVCARIVYYLGICARANKARLVQKD